MKNFDLYQANLDGTRLIEASAGTGKTFTLSGLYVRYIVEKGLMPEKILVLTFTNAATDELKSRLRSQLIECQRHLSGQTKVSDTDQKLFDLYEGYTNDPQSLATINLALASFDQATIMTINGFCQKIIDDYNSECGSPMLLQLIDKAQHIKQSVYEFWRLQQTQTPRVFLSLIPNIDLVADKLISLINKSHYRHIAPSVDWSNTTEIHQQFIELKDQWQQQQENLLDYLLAGDFNGVSYNFKKRSVYQQAMQDFFYNMQGKVQMFKASFIESKVKKDRALPPMPAFFSAFERFYDHLFVSYNATSSGNQLVTSFIYDCWLYVKKHLQSLLDERGLYGYDDQINIVHNSIDNNAKLVESIGAQWPCVMVDEFQDTDAMQLGIFDRCFFRGQHDVTFVGDPKQAIYDFRGADVFVYQQAKKNIDRQYQLGVNWRSSQDMLSASNTMFAIENAFKMPWMPFVPSQSQPQQKQWLTDQSTAVTVLNTPEPLRKQLLSAELKRLLAQAHITTDDGNVSLKASDIAIVVRSNRQAIDVYEYLLGQQLPVSLWSESGVFSTEMARQLYFLLRAMVYPSERYIKTSLHGLLFDVSLGELSHLDMATHVSQFIDYKLNGRQLGFAQALNRLFLQQKVYQRLLQRMDGERHYTDLMQLLELLDEQDQMGRNDEQILSWVLDEMFGVAGAEQDEQRKRRLESDGHKIAIMTVHKSKGLEFACVFIPYVDQIKDGFAYAGENINLKACVSVHDDDQQGVIYWRHSQEAQKRYLQERSAENIRNLYVAITRAKHRVYLGLDKLDKKLKGYPIYPLLQAIETDQRLYTEINGVQPIDVKPLSEQPLFECQYKGFDRSLSKPQSIHSFSALAKKQSISHDVISESIDTIDFDNYYHFPKGSRSGTMQHEILENIQFNMPEKDIKQQVQNSLKAYDFDSRWLDCLTRQITIIVNVPLWIDGPCLSEVSQSIDEMEFMLPLDKIESHQIGQWLSSYRQVNTSFNQDRLKGFLIGFIDLIMVHQGQYYIVDYKSNHLGYDIQGYTDQQLKQSIQQHYYDLQFLLYSVALVKYLQIKVDDFDYDRHFGGVMYIYLRGVDGKAGQGIYKDKPAKELIADMIGAFHG